MLAWIALIAVVAIFILIQARNDNDAMRHRRRAPPYDGRWRNDKY
jgi:hypothetical protein